MQLSSTNKRILVLGDIHQEIDKLNKIIEYEAADVVVTTGDWFDSFNKDSDRDVRKAALQLRKNVLRDKVISIIGNHDCHYLWSNHRLKCSGYTDYKDTLIFEALGDDFLAVRDKLLWYLWIDDFLVTHAGLHYSYLPPSIVIGDFTKDNIDKWLQSEVEKNNIVMASGFQTWFTAAGYARGGNAKYGGLVWCDFDVEFEPIAGLSQLLGHTPHNIILAPREFGGMNVLESDNLDVDCHLNQWLIIHNQKLELKSYRDH